MNPTRRTRPAAEQLETAFSQGQDELLGTLYYLVGNLEDARDALQETFLKCWRHREQLPEIENLKAWIFRIAVNTGRDMRTTAWRRRRKPLGDESATLISHTQGPQADAMRREQLTLIRKTLQRLRPEEQEVFLLRQNGQMTYDKIAQALNIPVGTVKTRMRLALNRLREALEEK